MDLERRVSRLESAILPHDGDPDQVRIGHREDGSEEWLYLRRGIAVWTESTEPDPAA